MPVVTKSLADVVEDLGGGGVQRFDVNMVGYAGDHEALNVFKVLDCIDEGASQIEYWTEQSGRPEKVGQYRTIAALRLDEERACGAHIYRLRGWTIALVVSELLRERMLLVGAKGIDFLPVSYP